MTLAAAMQLAEGESYADMARRAKRLGYRGVAIPFDRGWTEADLVAIRQAFDEQGISIVEIACHCNFLTPRDDEVAGVVERLQRALAAGAILNCDRAVTCVGSRHPDTRQPLAPHPDNWSDATWDLLIQRIWALLGGVDDIGVSLCFEPCPTTTLNTLDRLAELNGDVATVRVRIALDPAAVFTPLGAEHPGIALAEIFSRLADTIAVARATDVTLIEAGPEPRIAPAPLGEGVLDYVTYLRLLDALDLDTPIVVKRQPNDEAYSAARDYLATAASTAGIQP